MAIGTPPLLCGRGSKEVKIKMDRLTASNPRLNILQMFSLFFAVSWIGQGFVHICSPDITAGLCKSESMKSLWWSRIFYIHICSPDIPVESFSTVCKYEIS